jgi:hypothetical protein
MASYDYDEDKHPTTHHDKKDLRKTKHNDLGRKYWTYEIKRTAFGRRVDISFTTRTLC